MAVIGIPKELKDHEDRVAITPAGVGELVASGHKVLIESDAGHGSQISNQEYEAAGARIVPGSDPIWEDTDLVLKVKEPLPEEFPRLREGQTLFTYLHLAANRDLTEELLKSRTTAIAYETVTAKDGLLPLLTPMSEIAGRLSSIIAADLLRNARGGRGVLMGGSAGVEAATTVVIGAGVAGWNAVRMAQGMESHTIVLDTNIARLREIDTLYRGAVKTLVSNRLSLEQVALEADVVIGAVLVPGALAPKLIDKETVMNMREGSVFIDISIDQGGCSETSHMTTHSEPTYLEHGVLHYCVGNMPGAVPRTATYALTNATLPFALALANQGLDALRGNAGFAEGLNCVEGILTNLSVASAHGHQGTSADAYLS